MHISFYSIVFLGLLFWHTGYAQSNKPVITRVSVEPEVNAPGAVFIEWQPSELGTETGYDLIRYAPGADEETFSLNNTNLTYRDNLARADENVIGYHVVATGFPGGEADGASVQHKTIFLTQPVYDTCGTNGVPNIVFTWTHYVGWGTNVSYSILYKQPGETTFTSTGIITSDTTDSISVSGNLIPGNTYQFLIRAENTANNSIISNSNIKEVQTAVPMPNSQTLTVNEVLNSGTDTKFNGTIDQPMANPDVFRYVLQQSQNSSFQSPNNIDTLIIPNAGTLSFNPNNQTANPNRYYRIQSENKCGLDTKQSNTVMPITLSYTNNHNAMTFNWNSCFEGLGPEFYNLFMSIDNGSFSIQASPPTWPFDLNIENLGNENNQKYCFYIQALAGNGAYNAKSNTVCKFKTPKVTMPDAFTPNGDGINETIGPDADNVEVVSFYFAVFNHFGTRIFESDRSSFKWNGSYNGKKVTEGAYPYYYKIEASTGEIVENRGLIQVVFP